MLTCPQCESEHIISRRRGRKIGSVLVGIVGAARGVACAIRGAQAGVLMDAAMGLPGSLLDAVDQGGYPG